MQQGYRSEPAGSISGFSGVVKAACPHDCPDTCAMLVTVEEGKATKIQGDPHAPFTEGTICTKVSHYLERTYSPDRLHYPMKRIGRKGEGRFRRITWDEALDEIAGKLKAAAGEIQEEALSGSGGLEGTNRRKPPRDQPVDLRARARFGLDAGERRLDQTAVDSHLVQLPAKPHGSSSASRPGLDVTPHEPRIVGIQLFILSEQTDRFFAWTIQNPLTAAFLGGAYWASFAMEFLAARRRVWAYARIAVPAVLIFTGMTLVVTLLHLGQFHLNSPDLITRGVAWAWLIVYAIVPGTSSFRAPSTMMFATMFALAVLAAFGTETDLIDPLLVLPAGQSATGSLFQVALLPSLPAGMRADGTVFLTVQFDDVAGTTSTIPQRFSVTSAAAAEPEPSAGILTAAGAALFALMGFRKLRQ